MNDCIILIGFMGAGKTTVGKILAKDLGYDLIDTDTIIESRLNMKISDIFRDFGEAYFRKEEKAVIHGLSFNRPAVISCGGGSVLDSDNADILKAFGKIIYLKVSAETVCERTADDTSRPLLSKGNISELLKSRDEIYSKVCDFSIDTDCLKATEIADKIKKMLKY